MRIWLVHGYNQNIFLSIMLICLIRCSQMVNIYLNVAPQALISYYMPMCWSIFFERISLQRRHLQYKLFLDLLSAHPSPTARYCTIKKNIAE